MHNMNKSAMSGLNLQNEKVSLWHVRIFDLLTTSFVSNIFFLRLPTEEIIEWYMKVIVHIEISFGQKRKISRDRIVSVIPDPAAVSTSCSYAYEF